MAGTRKKRTLELIPQHDPRAPLDSPAFLSAAQPVLSLLTADLLERADASPAVTAELRRSHAAEHAAGRTAEPYEVWRRQRMVQVAAAWLLSCVFVRVLEDRGLLARHRLAGPGAEDSQRQFGELAPYLGPRDYLLTLFRELAKTPATAPLFDARHNLVWRLGPSQGGAQALLDLLRAPQPDAPAFRFGQTNTRFLGDLYQDISADVRETYALLQTPDFIESFILDRTLDPALAEYGVNDTTLIDPTCGSGHFLLGAFARLLDAQRHHNPGLSAESHANNAMSRVFGVDINPYAVAIARFRLTLAFWDAIGLRRLEPVQSACPPLNVVVGDSLFHAAGEQRDFMEMPGQTSTAWYGPTFAFDDEQAAKAILGRRFSAVVGNPPYIGVKDAALRETYRKRFPDSASGKYALSAPFLELFFRLARHGGFTGQITSNAFIKREFGKKLVETVLPRFDLTLIVNTAGAYIPGHGTPTVLIFGRHRKSEDEAAEKVLAVLSKRGEPGIPGNPAAGEVWTSIAQHWHEVGFNGEYISVERVFRKTLDRHPWSLEGGGAGQLKTLIEQRTTRRLADIVTAIGFDAIMGEDDLYTGPPDWLNRLQVSETHSHILIEGESVRDWALNSDRKALFPYNQSLQPSFDSLPSKAQRHLWTFRTKLINRLQFGKNTLEAGLKWFEYRSFYKAKRSTPLSIAFAFVATHNHFVFDSAGKIFKQTAPIIKLPADSKEDDYLTLLPYLNSSLACFWLKQVGMNRGSRGQGGGLTSEAWEQFYELASTRIEGMPIPELTVEQRKFTITIARRLQTLAADRSSALSYREVFEQTPPETIPNEIERRDAIAHAIEQEMRDLVEMLDWYFYWIFGLVDEHLVGSMNDNARIPRPSDVLYAQAVLSGQHSTRYFQLCRLPSPQEIVNNAANSSSALYVRRLDAIRRSPFLSLLEQPAHKRTFREGFRPTDPTDPLAEWLAESLEKRLFNAQVIPQQQLVLDILEERRVAVAINTCARDGEGAFIYQLLTRSSVPFLAAYCYTESGLEKRSLWENTWSLQRREDVGEKVDSILVPPDYNAQDFRDASFYRLRGELDVPKERFISYPGCESDEDGEPIYGWTGWDHLQRASAVMDLFYKRKNDEGWSAERLTPILAGLLELLPWLKQWHNDPDADGSRMGDDYEAVLDEELRGLGLTREKLRAWRPAPGRGRGTRAATKAGRTAATDDAPTTDAPAKRRDHPPSIVADEAPAEEAPAKRRGRPPRPAVAVEAVAPGPPAAPAAVPELALFPGEPGTQPRKRGRPKKT